MFSTIFSIPTSKKRNFGPFSPFLDPDLLPPAPNISVTPPKPEFLIGDTVSITCAAPAPGDRVRGFRFSATSGWVTDVRSSRRSFSHTFNVTGTRDGGFHTCSYTVLRPGRGNVHSPASRAVVINVRDRPTQPKLTVTPSSITVEGQPLVFSCQAPPGDAERRFGIFQEDLEVTGGIWEGSGGSGVRLRVERSGQNQTGNFSCRYEEMTEGRWITSYPSDAVQVIVKDPCPPPVLSVEPLSGVVATGHRLRLTCAAPRHDFRRRFRFFRDGAEVTPDAGDVIGGDGSELLFPRISREFAGNFSCRVEEEVGGAWLEAPPSRDVAVEVRASAQFELLPLVVGTAVGVASLLLGLLLAASLCRKRRGGSGWRGLRPGEDTGTFSMGDLEEAS
ncbi:PREDICTED: leukocyte immunoglobulin-like receptor subfamily B member 2 [Pseudopodoces humilis]|uniref:leukocyte immunoglobulin-like receptor subfamily B member 2 n=1 Tax=Pseudopodoces humilis TaxID=181119 RepID=UPI0006B77687|nr:PREDICTED: leukocyte immunoglobulin-like receptor subfamily B member 2 [Pseudopodoces humilis]